MPGRLDYALFPVNAVNSWQRCAQVLGKLSDQQRSLLEERFKAAERQAASQGLDIGYRRLERANGGANGYAQEGGYPQDSGYAGAAGYAADYEPAQNSG